MKTLILGATPNPKRYAFLAANKLVGHEHEIVNVGIKKGEVAGAEILNGMPEVEGVDTVTLYLGPKKQEPYYDWLVGDVRPRRIILTPVPRTPNWRCAPGPPVSKRRSPARWCCFPAGSTLKNSHLANNESTNQRTQSPNSSSAWPPLPPVPGSACAPC